MFTFFISQSKAVKKLFPQNQNVYQLSSSSSSFNYLLSFSARDYVQENLQFAKSGSLPLDGLKQRGILQTLLSKFNIEQDEVVRIVTDLFLAAADTVSVYK